MVNALAPLNLLKNFLHMVSKTPQLCKTQKANTTLSQNEWLGLFNYALLPTLQAAGFNPSLTSSLIEQRSQLVEVKYMIVAECGQLATKP